ncbi:MAG: FtsX-like permease family protein [Gemmatimonadetes bacterium]|uniref:FtsX-like permease family protein n=1 Tax=Candidatus Kutchimonas denitrificans TaxID=3056748 RepID=A0AAE4ZAY2_9BACT|nr:FtsX-like permease family protein [Gemmatimonadota bacterium]NIR74095.1 FtsX-like permease family protein [Candidatus Kutchimonas denitrificans]NIS01657.1 FtsX-like permease family protein [Gemmatimonadota bacterium]NIT67395.1 FtsX-like permease family protein [Gemmatimonadota bacterium]NIU52758.1 FtsX-like permease family protein [Gemmatimonadota bacterium]
MKISRAITSSLRALTRHKLRTFLMMLGTLIGVTALTVVMVLGRGTQDAVMQQVERMFSGSSIILTSGSGMRRGGPHGSGPTTTLLPADIEAIEEEVPAVLVADRLQGLGRSEVAFEGAAADVRVLGHSQASPEVWNRGANRGSYFSEADVATSARVAVAGTTVVRTLFGDLDPIGQQIRIGTVPFEVIGVLEPFGIDPHGLDKDNEIHVPYTTVMRRLRNVDYIAASKILVDPDADLDATAAAIEELLRARHGLAAGEPNDFRLITPTQVREMIASSNSTFGVFLPIVALIAIIAGGAVVANLMLLSVNERRFEIGLRKAVGARTRDVWWQFLLESTAVTTVGGLLAIGLAILTLGFIRIHGMADFVFPWAVTLVGLGVAVLVGLAAGVLPARRAARTDPIDALR